MDATLRKQKLAKLLEIGGYDTLDELMEVPNRSSYQMFAYRYSPRVF
jgi:hypothetical protein